MSSHKALFEGEPTYIDGYVPSSLDSPHSSLIRTATWLGMGIVLSAVAFAGIFVFGLATHIFETQEAGMNYVIGGIVGVAVCFIVGFGLVHVGRKDYHEYKKRTGRLH